MGKAFSEAELQRIKQRLLSDSEPLFAQQGVRKTTIDQLCKNVGIAKGTFYRFYDTKEALLFDIFVSLEAKIKQQVTDELAVHGLTLKQQIIRVILAQFSAMSAHPILQMILQPEEFTAFADRLGEDQRKALSEKDNKGVEQMLAPLLEQQKLAINDPHEISAMLRALFVLVVHRDELMSNDFNQLLTFFVNAVINELIPEPS